MGQPTPLAIRFEIPLSWQGAVAELLPLALSGAAIVAYSLFVYRFYKFVARRDVFELRLTQYARGVEHVRNFLRVVLYLFEYVFVYPFLSVVWFLAFTFFLLVLSRETPVETVLLVSMSVVAAIRVTAYYSEDLSRDLAKLLPLALLGTFILDGETVARLPEVLRIAPRLLGHWRTVLYYLLGLIAVEFVLRFGRILWTRRIQTTETAQPPDQPMQDDGVRSDASGQESSAVGDPGSRR